MSFKITNLRLDPHLSGAYELKLLRHPQGAIECVDVRLIQYLCTLGLTTLSTKLCQGLTELFTVAFNAHLAVYLGQKGLIGFHQESLV